MVESARSALAESTVPPRPAAPLMIAISDCLTGAKVRYDGAGKRSGLCHDQLEGIFEFRGICPEVGIGMGVPRDPIQLVGSADRPRAVGVADPAFDVTDRLAAFGRAIAPQLADAREAGIGRWARGKAVCPRGLTSSACAAAGGAPARG